MDCWTVDEGLDGLSRNVDKYQPPIRNILEERNFHFFIYFFNIFGEAFGISEVRILNGLVKCKSEIIRQKAAVLNVR
jgi:hypothetical protein